MSIWKQIRKEHNLTQKEVAEQLNMSHQAISLFESGKRKVPNKFIIYYLKLRGNEDDLKLIEMIDKFGFH